MRRRRRRRRKRINYNLKDLYLLTACPHHNNLQVLVKVWPQLFYTLRSVTQLARHSNTRKNKEALKPSIHMTRVAKLEVKHHLAR
jgi:hypothetical protein